MFISFCLYKLKSSVEISNHNTIPHIDNHNLRNCSIFRRGSTMKFAIILIFCLFVATVVSGCSIDGSNTATVEVFNMKGRCRERRLLKVVACACYAFTQSRLTNKFIRRQCRQLFRTSLSFLRDRCPSSFLEPGTTTPSRALLKAVTRAANSCFQSFPSPSPSPMIVSPEPEPLEVSTTSRDIDFDDSMMLHVERMLTAQGTVSSLNKSVKCLRCLRLGLCVNRG